jgi:hypothetical protein
VLPTSVTGHLPHVSRHTDTGAFLGAKNTANAWRLAPVTSLGGVSLARSAMAVKKNLKIRCSYSFPLVAINLMVTEKSLSPL